MPTETTQAVPGRPEGRVSQETPRRSLPRWKKVLLTAATFIFLLGLAVQGFALLRSGDDPLRQHDLSSGQRRPGEGPDMYPGGRSLTPWVGKEGTESFPPGSERSGETPTGGRATIEDWSPALMKGGMSFLVGFCIGFALRAFFKISAAFVGLVLLAIFGLSYAGIVEVNWVTLQTWFETALASVKDQTAGFQTFMTGSLPSAAMASAGLFTGIRKN